MSGSLNAGTRFPSSRRSFAPKPLRLPSDLVCDRIPLPGLSFEKLIPPICEVVVPSGDAKRTAGVDSADFQDLVGDRSQECPVVSRHEVAERGSTQESFQPDDAGQIEVIGWFVEEQDVGSADELPGQRQALPPPAGHRLGELVVVFKSDLRKRDRDPGVPLVVLEMFACEGGQE